MLRFSQFIVLLLAVSILGCGKSGPKMPKMYPVRGKVTYQGKPVTNCTITLGSTEPNPGYEGGFSGKLSPTGEFQLASSQGKAGAPAGKYKVMLVIPPDEAFKAMMGGGGKKTVDAASPFPKEYQSLSSSKKEVVVTPDNNNNLLIEL
jgi:hypothetical protein